MSTSKAAQAVRALSLNPDNVERWDAADRARIKAASPVKKRPSQAGVDHEVEPAISDKESIQKWRKWLKEEVKAYASTVHPRRRVGDAPPTAIPLLCSHAELMGATNVGVRLYFDLLRLFFGFAVLGLLCHAPSFIASILYVDAGAYSASSGFIPSFPTALNLLSLGARAQELDGGFNPVSGCPANDNPYSTCELLNTLTAALDVLYTLFFFVCLLRFQRYARGLDLLDRGENVMIAEYSIELHGLKGAKDVSPGQVKEHVEKALQAHAKAMLVAKRERHRHDMWQAFLDGACHEVVDVTMISNDRQVLKGLMSMATAEAKVPMLESKKKFMGAMGSGAGSLASMDKKIESAMKRRDRRRDTLAKRSDEPFRPVGAIITFNKEEAVGPAMELFSTGTQLSCCPPAKAAYSRMDTGDGKRRRLKAFEPGRPQDIRYENLHARFSYTTAARRMIGNLLLAIIIIVGMVVTIAGVFFKDSAGTIARIVVQTVQTAQAAGVQAAVADMASGFGSGDLGSGIATIVANTTSAGDGAQCTAADLAIVQSQLSDLSLERIETLFTDITTLLSRDPSSLSVAEASTLAELTGLLVAALKCFAAPLFTVVVSVVTVVLNLVIGVCVKQLQEFGKFSSISEMHLSEVVKLAFTTFINTAFIQILVNQATGPSILTAGIVRDNHICFIDPEAAGGGAASELVSQVSATHTSPTTPPAHTSSTHLHHTTSPTDTSTIHLTHHTSRVPSPQHARTRATLNPLTRPPLALPSPSAGQLPLRPSGHPHAWLPL